MQGDEEGLTELVDDAPQLPRSRRWLWATFGVAVTAAVLGMVAGQFIVSPRQLAAEAAAPRPSLITATVGNEVITSTAIARGTVTAEQAVGIGLGRLVDLDATDNVEGGGDGSSVITRVNSNLGDQVAAGSVPVEVSGRPVLLLIGSRPMFRDIRPGSVGPDVEQLQAALIGLGYMASGSADGEFGSVTQRALENLYASLGYQTAQTDNGDGSAREAVASAEAAVTAAKRAVEDADATTPDAVERTREDLATAQANLARVWSSVGTVAPRNEIVFLPSLPMKVTSIDAKVGFTAPARLLSLAQDLLIIRATLPNTDAGNLTIGTMAGFDIAGTPMTGTVTALTPGVEGQQEIAIQPDATLPFDRLGETTRVTLPVQLTDVPTLTVPAGAISTTASGDRIVIRVGAGEELTRIPVTTGAAGDQRVSITPRNDGDLSQGDKVLVGG